MRRLIPLVVLLAMCAAGCIPGVGGANQLPAAYIDSISATEASPGETVAFDGHGTDPDGTVVAYRWRSSIDGDLSAKANFETSLLSEGEHIVYLKVQDNNGDWSPEVRSAINIVAAVIISAPVINSFDTDPGSIASGETSTLSWGVSGATTVSIDQGIGNVALSGTRVASPSTTTTYTLTATNDAGSVTVTTQVMVSTPSPPAGLPTINSFTANPGSITVGDSSTLSWDVTNATTVVINPGVGAVSLVGSTSVSPGTTTGYTLTATNAAGWIVFTVAVTVSAPPLPPAEQTVTLAPVPAETGSVYKNDIVSSYMLTGDTNTDISIRAYSSFNIDSLAGVDVVSAELAFTMHPSQPIVHTPWADLAPLWVGKVNYGIGPLQLSDYDLTSTPFGSSFDSVPGVINITSMVQSAVSAGDPRFQVRTHFAKATDNDGVADYIRFSTATLTITYIL